MLELDGTDFTVEDMEQRLGIKIIPQSSKTILEDFTTLVPTTLSYPTTRPRMTKVICTFNGVTVIPPHLASTVPVQSTTKIPSPHCLPILR